MALLMFLLASTAFAKVDNPLPFPVFLKAGFSSVLEFDDVPTRVVLGDSQSFQVEKLEYSLVIKTLAPYATSNMFVYFKTEPPRLFVLTASEDAEPTYYHRFEKPAVPKPPDRNKVGGIPPRSRILKAQFDTRKDYLTVEVVLSSSSAELTKPNWDLVRIRHGTAVIAPSQLWAERKEIQKDSQVKARFIFAKPNIPRTLVGVSLVIPIANSINPIRMALGGAAR